MNPRAPHAGRALRGTAALALAPLAEADFATVAALAGTIWHEHYAAIISPAQIAYMLAGRYTPANLRRYLAADDRSLDVLRVEGVPVGYCSWARTGEPGELKLEQLYLLAAYRGQGLGAAMLQHVEEQARQRACRTLVLTVNRHNAGAIAFYRRRGLVVRAQACFDIGQGYVMDDYVMEKTL